MYIEYRIILEKHQHLKELSKVLQNLPEGIVIIKIETIQEKNPDLPDETRKVILICNQVEMPIKEQENPFETIFGVAFKKNGK